MQNGSGSAGEKIDSDETLYYYEFPSQPRVIPKPPEPSTSILLLWLFLVTVATFAITLTAPPNLLQTNEHRVGAYVSDILQNGNWAIQHDLAGNITSKPPMFAWLSAMASLAVGELNRFSLYFPSALGVLLSSWVLFFAGRKYFGWRTGFVSGLIFLLSVAAESLFTSTRFDGLFAFSVACAAFAAFHAWNTGKGWTWFWVAAAVATLVKGPLGILLAGLGLIAVFWEYRNGNRAAIRGSHWVGIGIFLLICGGWFALAYRKEHYGLIQKMLINELFNHAVGKETERYSVIGILYPFYSFLTAFLPWSPVAAFSLWRIWKYPTKDVTQRRLERFLFCAIVGGLIIFCVSPHQRARLITPLLPLAALLTGREVARLLQQWNKEKIFRTALACSVFYLCAVAVENYFISPLTRHTQQTREVQRIAQTIVNRDQNPFPLTHAGDPFALQMFLKTYRNYATVGQAAELLRGPSAAFVAVTDSANLRLALGSNAPAIYELARCRVGDKPLLSIVSNRPKMEEDRSNALISGDVKIELDGARLIDEHAGEFTFFAASPHSSITLWNLSNLPQKISVKIHDGGNVNSDSRQLAAGEKWRVLAPQNYSAR